MSIWDFAKDAAEFAATAPAVHLVTTVPEGAGKAVDGAVKVTEAVERVPQGVVDFTTLPLKVGFTMFDIGLWVLDHLKEIFIALMALIILVALMMLRSLWSGVDSRLKEVGKGNRNRGSRGARGRHRQPAEPQHRPNTWVNGQSICVASRSDARKMAKKAGHADVVFDHPCALHRNSKVWQVQ